MNRYFSMVGALLTCVAGCGGGASADGASARLDGAALPVQNIQQDTFLEASASSVPVRLNLEQTQKDIFNELAFVAHAKVGTHACGDDAAAKFVFVWADEEGASGGGRAWGVSTDRNIESQGERQASVGSCSVTIESLEPDGAYMNVRGTFTAEAVDATKAAGILKAAASARPSRKLDGSFQMRLLAR